MNRHYTSFLLAAVLLVKLPCYAQEYGVEWHFGLTQAGWDVLWALDTDPLGNVVSTGYFSDSTDFDPGPGSFYLSPIGDDYGSFFGHGNGFIQKLDPNGNLLWAIPLFEYDFPNGDLLPTFQTLLEVAPNGDIFVVSRVFSEMDLDPGPGTIYANTFGPGYQWAIQKFDSDGNFVDAWATGLNDDNGTISAIAGDLQGNLYMTGTYTDFFDGDPGAGYWGISAPITDGDAPYVIKLDSDGDPIWGRAFEASGEGPFEECIGFWTETYSTDDSHVFDLAVDPFSGDVAVCGWYINDFQPSPGLIWNSCLHLACDIPGIGNMDIASDKQRGFIVTMDDTTGTTEWAYEFRDHVTVPWCEYEELEDFWVSSCAFDPSGNLWASAFSDQTGYSGATGHLSKFGPDGEPILHVNNSMSTQLFAVTTSEIWGASFFGGGQTWHKYDGNASLSETLTLNHSNYSLSNGGLNATGTAGLGGELYMGGGYKSSLGTIPNSPDMSISVTECGVTYSACMDGFLRKISTSPCTPQATSEEVSVCFGESYTFPDGTVEVITSDMVYTSYAGADPCPLWIETTIVLTSEGCSGCTDPEACNFDIAAEIDDASCVYAASCQQCSGEVDGTGVVLNLPWEAGETCILYSSDGTCIANGVANENCECVLTYPETYTGCTDEQACNYNNCAFFDDGSCCTDYCVNIALTDSWGDGWDGATLTITDHLGNLVDVVGENFVTGGFYSESLCLSAGCYVVSVGGGLYGHEHSWIIDGVNGGVMISGSDPTDDVVFYVGDTNCDQQGCTDPTACNYNAEAYVDDGSCVYTCPGCTDSSASNFNPNATIDDGSCYYFYLDTNGITVRCTGCEAGDLGEVNGFMYQAVDNTTLLEVAANGTWPLSYVCTSLVTETTNLFQNNSTFNDDISSWDMSGVVNMMRMFDGASGFNQNINSWDVSGVYYFTDIFRGANAFNQPLDQWDMSSALWTNGMFSGASAFNQPVGTWNFENLQNCSFMFYQASSFDQDVSNWNMSNVQGMQYMFEGATVFNQPLNSWDVSNVQNMGSMFALTEAFNQPLDNWDVSSVSSVTYMFYLATAFNQDISSWCVPEIPPQDILFAYGSPLQVLNLTEYFPQWGTCPQDELWTVWDVLANSSDHVTFASSLISSGPDGLLNSVGSFTVFAPTDAAFDMVPDDVLNQLMADPTGALADVLLGHVASTELLSSSFADGMEVVTLSGDVVLISFGGSTGILVNTASLTLPDVQTDNGVVHVIDAVLLPTPPPTLFDVTFRLDMNEAPAEIIAPEVNGIFNNWCGNCNPLEDLDGDGIWETTLALPAGEHLWKFSSNNWEYQEFPDPAQAPCFILDEWGYINRSITLTGDTILPAYCWESCTLCPGAADNTAVDVWVCPGGAYTLPNGETLYNLVADTVIYTPNADASLTITSIGIEEILSLEKAYDCENDALLVTISEVGTFQGMPDTNWEFLANGQFYTVNGPGTITVPGVTPDQAWRLSMFETNNCAPDYWVFPECTEPPCENAWERVVNGNFDDLTANVWTETSLQLDGSTPTGYGIIDPTWTFNESAQAAWLGGFWDGSITSISQDLYLPLTTEQTVLQWWQWHTGYCHVDDVLTISLDDTVIFTFNVEEDPNCGALDGWYLMEVDISSFTTGQDYTLTFQYTQNGTDGYNTCIIDNVSIQTCPCQPDITEETVQVCQWDSYTFPDGTTVDNINAPFTQYSYSSPPPCVVGIATTVEVLPVPVTFIADTVCHGETYTYADGTSQVINSAPTFAYQSILTAASGCDSVVYEAPIYIPQNFTSEEITLCAGSDFTFPDGSQVLSILEDATYLSTLVAASGCDSLIQTTLTVLPACTDPIACNFSPSASCSDNSTCQYTSNAVVDMTAQLWTLYYDTDCDGEDGSIEMEFFADQTWFSPSSIPGNWSLCGTTYTNTFSGYDGIYQGSWNGAGFEGILLNDPFILEQCIWLYPIGPGCTNPEATNYNPAATSDDGSCITPGGCTDPAACNYDPFALVDDGSCAIVPGDVNNDCEVGTIDLLAVIGDFNCSESDCPVPEGESPDCAGDVNNDCSVSSSDILFVLGLFGTGI